MAKAAATSRHRRAIGAALLALMTLIGAAPARTDERAGTCQSDAMLVFDASGSMSTTDYALSLPRIARVKQALARVVPEVAPTRRLGLIVYGEGAYNDCGSISLRLRPTLNAADLLLGAVQDINPRGRTPLTESVERAAEVLNFRERAAVVVLLTDGEETCGGDPCRTAALLKRAGRDLTIHVVGYREEQTEYFTVRCMADETGGRYFPVSTEDELVDALRKTLGCPFLSDRAPVPGNVGPRHACLKAPAQGPSCATPLR